MTVQAVHVRSKATNALTLINQLIKSLNQAECIYKIICNVYSPLFCCCQTEIDIRLVLTYQQLPFWDLSLAFGT